MASIMINDLIDDCLEFVNKEPALPAPLLPVPTTAQIMAASPLHPEPETAPLAPPAPIPIRIPSSHDDLDEVLRNCKMIMDSVHQGSGVEFLHTEPTAAPPAPLLSVPVAVSEHLQMRGLNALLNLSNARRRMDKFEEVAFESAIASPPLSSEVKEKKDDKKKKKKKKKAAQAAASPFERTGIAFTLGGAPTYDADGFDDHGRHRVHHAVIDGDAKALQEELQKGVDVANTKCRNGSEAMPVHFAALHNRAPLIHLLAAHGANLDAKEYEGLDAEKTALMHAVFRGHHACVHALLERKANHDIQNSAGRTAFDMMLPSASVSSSYHQIQQRIGKMLIEASIKPAPPAPPAPAVNLEKKTIETIAPLERTDPDQKFMDDLADAFLNTLPTAPTLPPPAPPAPAVNLEEKKTDKPVSDLKHNGTPSKSSDRADWILEKVRKEYEECEKKLLDDTLVKYKQRGLERPIDCRGCNPTALTLLHICADTSEYSYLKEITDELEKDRTFTADDVRDLWKALQSDAAQASECGFVYVVTIGGHWFALTQCKNRDGQQRVRLWQSYSNGQTLIYSLANWLDLTSTNEHVVRASQVLRSPMDLTSVKSELLVPLHRLLITTDPSKFATACISLFGSDHGLRIGKVVLEFWVAPMSSK